MEAETVEKTTIGAAAFGQVKEFAMTHRAIVVGIVIAIIIAIVLVLGQLGKIDLTKFGIGKKTSAEGAKTKPKTTEKKKVSDNDSDTDTDDTKEKISDLVKTINDKQKKAKVN